MSNISPHAPKPHRSWPCSLFTCTSYTSTHPALTPFQLQGRRPLTDRSPVTVTTPHLYPEGAVRFFSLGICRWGWVLDDCTRTGVLPTAVGIHEPNANSNRANVTLYDISRVADPSNTHTQARTSDSKLYTVYGATDEGVYHLHKAPVAMYPVGSPSPWRGTWQHRVRCHDDVFYRGRTQRLP